MEGVEGDALALLTSTPVVQSASHAPSLDDGHAVPPSIASAMLSLDVVNSNVPVPIVPIQREQCCIVAPVDTNKKPILSSQAKYYAPESGEGDDPLVPLASTLQRGYYVYLGMRSGELDVFFGDIVEENMILGLVVRQASNNRNWAVVYNAKEQMCEKKRINVTGSDRWPTCSMLKRDGFAQTSIAPTTVLTYSVNFAIDEWGKSPELSPARVVRVENSFSANSPSTTTLTPQRRVTSEDGMDGLKSLSAAQLRLYENLISANGVLAEEVKVLKKAGDAANLKARLDSMEKELKWEQERRICAEAALGAAQQQLSTLEKQNKQANRSLKEKDSGYQNILEGWS